MLAAGALLVLLAAAPGGVSWLAQAKPEAAEPDPARTCPPPLRHGCEARQGSCQLACPPQWNPNPGAPAFTPTDRAGCLRGCFSRYLSCLRLYGCG